MPSWKDRATPAPTSWKDRAIAPEQITAEKDGPVAAAFNKFAQGAAFNLTDELGGVLEAGGSKVGVRGLGGKLSDIRQETPEEDKMSFADVYRQRRDQNRLRQKGEALAYPRTSLGAELIGGATSGLLTANPAGLGGKIALGAGESAAQGFGSSEADTLGGLARDTAIAGTVGGATAGALRGAGSLVDRSGVVDVGRRALVDPIMSAAKNIQDRSTRFANERALKAVYGQNSPGFEKLSLRDRTQQAGADLLAHDEAGKPVVGWFTNAESALPRIKEKSKYFNQSIRDDVGGTMDRLNPNGISGTDISEHALDYATKRIPVGKSFDTPRNKVLQFAEDQQGRDIPWRESQDLKNALHYKEKNPLTRDLGLEASNELNRAVSDSMEKGVSRAAKTEGISPEDARNLELYPYLKSKADTYINAAEAARKRVKANLSNRRLSPSDMFVGGVLGGTSMINDPGDLTGGGTMALGGALANKALRGRGSAFAANAAKSVADFIESGTAAAQKYGPYIQKVLQDAGPESAALALYILFKNHPQARGTLVTEGKPK